MSACLLLACSRSADIVDEPDAGTDIGPNAPRTDGGVPRVEDADLTDPRFLPCAERETELECVGTNDFPCDFASWVPELAESCQQATDCRTNGWVEIALGADGCALELGMDEPNEAMVACLVEELGAHRCPCAATSASHFLGVANDGCQSGPEPCRSGEFPCAVGFVCEDGVCVPG